MRTLTPTKHLFLAVLVLALMSVTAIAQTCSASFTSSVNVPAKTASFTNTSTGTGLNYFWNFGDGNYSSLASPTHVYTSNGTYIVTLHIFKNDSSCFSSFTDTIQVGAPCHANFYYTIDAANAHTYSFHNTSTGTNPVYYWDFGDGNYSSLTNPSHTYTTNGTFTVNLYVHNLDSSCFDSKQVSIIVTNTCTAIADFTYWVDSLNYRKIHFQNTSVINNPIYQWAFSDGGSSTQASPTYTFPVNANGTYYVYLKVMNSADTTCQDTVIKTITFTNPCNAGFSYYPDSMNNNPTKLNFVSHTSATGLTYNWNFGDGYSSSLKNPVHQYSSPGTYNICLTVTNPADSFCYDHLCHLVTVGGTSCNAAFTTSMSSGGSAYFYPSIVDTSNFIYHWSFGDGSSSAYPTTYHHYGSSGIYVVCLQVSSRDSMCWDMHCDSLIISQPCNASFTDSIFGNGDVYFHNTSSTSIAPLYFWYFGDGGTSNVQNPVHHFSQNGAYSVCLTIGSAHDSSCWSYFCDTIVINTFPVDTGCNASFTYANDSMAGAVNFFNYSQPSSGATYYWSFGDGSTSTVKNPSHYYAQNGWYLVCLTVASVYDSNCWDTQCDTILVTTGGNDSLCSANFTYFNDSTNGSTVHFVSTSSGSNLTYFWNFGSGTSTLANPTFTFPAAGMYMVTLTITNSLTGCSSTIVKPVTVNSSGPCVANFSWYVTGNGTVNFVNTSSGNIVLYSWSFGDGATSNQQNPTHTYTASGIYHILLMVFGANGCHDSMSIDIYIPVSSGCDASFYAFQDSMNYTYYFSPAYNTPGTTYLWTFDNGDTSSSQYPAYNYTTPGYHMVCLTVTNWMDSCWASWCDTIFVNGTTGLKEAGAVSVSNAYPVPFTDELKLDLTSPGTTRAKVTLVDLTGKIVEEKEVTLQKEQNTLTFDTRDLSRGVYFVNIMSDYGHTVKKICK